MTLAKQWLSSDYLNTRTNMIAKVLQELKYGAIRVVLSYMLVTKASASLSVVCSEDAEVNESEDFCSSGVV
jgi:hypothetical protein